MTNRMPLSLRTLVLTVFVSCGLAQNQGVVPKLISNSLPACGQSCEILIKAQAACVPPAAPVSDPTIYQSCFCQSAFLTTLLTGGPNSLCPACSPAEMGTIETWFQASCAPPDQTPPDQAPAPPAAQPDDPAPAPPAGAAPTKAPDATKGGATISEKPPPNNKGWSVEFAFSIFFSLSCLWCWKNPPKTLLTPKTQVFQPLALGPNVDHPHSGLQSPRLARLLLSSPSSPPPRRRGNRLPARSSNLETRPKCSRNRQSGHGSPTTSSTSQRKRERDQAAKEIQHSRQSEIDEKLAEAESRGFIIYLSLFLSLYPPPLSISFYQALIYNTHVILRYGMSFYVIMVPYDTRIMTFTNPTKNRIIKLIFNSNSNSNSNPTNQPN